MAHRSWQGFSRAFLLVIALLAPALAPAAINIRLDFDDDNDPSTVRTVLSAGLTTATVRFILEVGSLPLPTGPVWLAVEEGCCEAPIWMGHRGTSVEYESLAFDPGHVVSFIPSFPTCTYCCPWFLELVLNEAAPVAAGGRYFIGQATWSADCNVEAACTPPNVFVVTGNVVDGQVDMSFTCPVIATEPRAWGVVKTIYR